MAMRDYETPNAYAQKLGDGQIAGQGYYSPNTPYGDTLSKQSPITQMGLTIEQVGQLCEQVELLAIKLVGPQPREVKQMDRPPAPAAIFSAITATAISASERIQMAMQDIARINAQLP